MSVMKDYVDIFGGRLYFDFINIIEKILYY